MVPIVYHIFGVSSSTVLGIEGYLTCWKDELGNNTLGTKAQNMHQLRVLGENLIFCTIRNFIHALKKEPLKIMHLHTSRRMDGP